MLKSLILILIFVYPASSFAQGHYTSIGFDRTLELLNENTLESDSSITLLTYSGSGPLLTNRFFKKEHSYYCRTKFLFLESTTRDQLTFEYELKDSLWHKAFDELIPELSNIKNNKRRNKYQYERVIRVTTNDRLNEVLRYGMDNQLGNRFEKIWWELRSWAPVSAVINWTLTDEENNPIQNAEVYLTKDGSTHRTSKDGVFKLQSALTFFDRTKFVAVITKMGYERKTIEVNLDEFEQGAALSFIEDKRTIKLKKLNNRH